MSAAGWRSLLRRYAPALLAVASALVFLGLGSPRRAEVLGAVGVLAAILGALGVDLGRGARAAGRAVGAVIAAAFWTVTILPAWLWSVLRRRDPVRPGDRDGRPHWQIATPDRAVTRLAAIGEPLGRRSTPFGALSRAIAVAIVLVVLNYGVGWVWDTALPEAAPAAPTPSRPREVTSSVPHDPRADLPAMAAYPWRERYFDDLQRTSGTYWPFTESRPLSFSSPYINIDDWARRSYEPRSSGPRPTVWVFGGSTTFGEGQRDDFTIPSDVSRLAERAGRPIEVVNFGQRGWTHYQEMILFQELVSSRRAPDIAVFYDGANEITTQALMTEAVPATTNAISMAERLSGLSTVTRATTGPPLGTALADLYTAYTQHSAVHRLVRGLGLSSAAGAETKPDTTSGDPSRGFNPDGLTPSPTGQGMNYSTTIQDARDALKVYAEGRFLTQAIADQHHVDAMFFWQPTLSGDVYKWASTRIRPPVINISRVLDEHREVFIDGGHTNEVGARIVARAIWSRLSKPIGAWYDSHS